VGLQEPIDRLSYLPGRGEAHAFQGRSSQDAEPDLNLIEPGSVGGSIVEVDLGMSRKPAIGLGFVGLQVVQDDVHLLVRIGSDDLVHEEQKLPPSATTKMSGLG